MNLIVSRVFLLVLEKKFSGFGTKKVVLNL